MRFVNGYGAEHILFVCKRWRPAGMAQKRGPWRIPTQGYKRTTRWYPEVKDERGEDNVWVIDTAGTLYANATEESSWRSWRVMSWRYFPGEPLRISDGCKEKMVWSSSDISQPTSKLPFLYFKQVERGEENLNLKFCDIQTDLDLILIYV